MNKKTIQFTDDFLFIYSSDGHYLYPLELAEINNVRALEGKRSCAPWWVDCGRSGGRFWKGWGWLDEELAFRPGHPHAGHSSTVGVEVDGGETIPLVPIQLGPAIGFQLADLDPRNLRIVFVEHDRGLLFAGVYPDLRRLLPPLQFRLRVVCELRAVGVEPEGYFHINIPDPALEGPAQAQEPFPFLIGSFVLARGVLDASLLLFHVDRDPRSIHGILLR